MNITKTNDLSLISVGRNRIAPVGPEGRQLLELGRRSGWDVAHLGQAEMPAERVNLSGWMIVPAEEDTGPVPERSMRRIQAIFEEGLRPKGFVVVHETPALLPERVSEDGGTLRVSTIDPRIKSTATKVARAVGVIALGLALLPSILALIMAAVAGLVALLLPLALVAGLAVDPILVAVTEEGDWIEIDRWWTEE